MPVDYGDLPSWIEASGVLVAVGDTLRRRQRERVVDFSQTVADIIGDPDRLVAIGESDELLDIAEKGFHAAARARSADKRWLLAKVVASAVAGDDARIEVQDVYLDTVEALEPYHIRLLVTIATPRRGGGQLAGSRLVGAITEDELAERQPDDRHLVRPLLAALEREGLISDVAVGTLDYRAAWSLTGYGRRFLRFLPDGPFGAPELRHAEVTCWVDRRTREATIYARNLGPGDATVNTIEINAQAGFDWAEPPPLPAHLPAGEQVERSTTAPDPAMPIRTTLGWYCSGCGDTHATEQDHGTGA